MYMIIFLGSIYLVLGVLFLMLRKVDKVFKVRTALISWSLIYNTYILRVCPYRYNKIFNIYDGLPSHNEMMNLKHKIDLNLEFASKEVREQFKEQLKEKDKVFKWVIEQGDEDLIASLKTVHKQFLLEADGNNN